MWADLFLDALFGILKFLYEFVHDAAKCLKRYRFLQKLEAQDRKDGE